MTGGASGMDDSMVYALTKEGPLMVLGVREIDGANAVVSNVEKQGGKAICVKADALSINKLDAMT